MMPRTCDSEVPVRGVTVKGSIQQDPSNYLKGSVLPRFGRDDMERLHRNAVNAWWEDGCRPRCTRFGGSNNYQGSVGEGLWEFPQWYKRDALARGWAVVPYLEHHCSNPSAAEMGIGTVNGRVAAVLRTMATAAAVTLVLSGCSPRVSREQGMKVVRPSELVAIEGPAPEGRFYAKAGDNSLDGDGCRPAPSTADRHAPHQSRHRRALAARLVELSDLTRTRNVGVSEVGTVWDAVWLPPA